jgi:hypothetical protein
LIIELPWFFDLRKEMRGSFNWPGNEKREVAYKKTVIDWIASGCDAAIIYVNDIRKAVKRIKRYTYRKQYL